MNIVDIDFFDEEENSDAKKEKEKGGSEFEEEKEATEEPEEDDLTYYDGMSQAEGYKYAKSIGEIEEAERTTNWFKLHRKLQKNFLWQDKEAFCKRAAWVDLLMTACYSLEGGEALIDGRYMTWKRGQLVASVRFLKERWHWKSTAKVENFLRTLVSANMITKEVRQGISVITISNYGKYNKLPKGKKDSN